MDSVLNVNCGSFALLRMTASGRRMLPYLSLLALAG